MQEPKHDKERQIFQVERFTYFTDAVFAICITLLAIELNVHEIFPTDKLIWKQLSEMGFKFVGFVISFGIIGHYWTVHHRIFGYVKKNSTTLIWINQAFLLTVVTLPFSSGLLGEYSSNTSVKIPYGIYSLNLVLTGLMNCWIWMYVSNPKRQMLTREISSARIKLGLYRSLVIPIMFIISFLVFIFSPIAGYSVLLLIPVILHWGMKGMEKKAEKEESVMHRLSSKDTVIIPDNPKIK